MCFIIRREFPNHSHFIFQVAYIPVFVQRELCKTQLCNLFNGKCEHHCLSFSVVTPCKWYQYCKIGLPSPSCSHPPTHTLARAKFSLHTRSQLVWAPIAGSGITRETLQNQRCLGIMQPAEMSNYLQSVCKSPRCSGGRVNNNPLFVDKSNESSFFLL